MLKGADLGADETALGGASSSMSLEFGELDHVPTGESLADELGAAFGDGGQANAGLGGDDNGDELDPAFAQHDLDDFDDENERSTEPARSVPTTPQRVPRARNPSTPATVVTDEAEEAAAMAATTASLAESLAPTEALLARLRAMPHEDDAQIARLVRAAQDVVRRQERMLAADPQPSASASPS